MEEWGSRRSLRGWLSLWKIFFTPIQTDHDDDERLSPTFTVGSQRHRVEWEPDYVEELSIAAAPFVFVTRRGRRRWRQVSSNDSDASPAQYFVVLIRTHTQYPPCFRSHCHLQQPICGRRGSDGIKNVDATLHSSL